MTVSNKLLNKGAKLNSALDLKGSVKNRAAVSKKNFTLPVGTALTRVAGIDISAEDVGNACSS